MRLMFLSDGWDDYLWWQQQQQSELQRINLLLSEIMRRPFSGIGKPELLKNRLRGWWSRRITSEHRLVYRVTGSGDDQTLEIAQCRYHY